LELAVCDQVRGAAWPTTVGSERLLELRGGEHPPLLGYALEGMAAAILEGDPRPHDEVLDGRQAS
jgi:hypothetical protein